MGIFYWEKAFHDAEKKTGKMTLPPQKNMPVTPLQVIYNYNYFFVQASTLCTCLHVCIYTTALGLCTGVGTVINGIWVDVTSA